MKPNRLAIFAPYFPPRPRVGAIRPYKFATHLAKLDWEISVITIHDSKHSLSEIQRNQLKNIELFELFPQMDRTVSGKDQTRDEKTDTKNKRDSKIANWLDRQFPLDTWLPFLWFSREKVLDYLQEFKPSVLLSTADPWSGAYVAENIAKKYQIPWICDLRDPWTLCGTRFPRKGFFARRIEKRSEKKILKQANAVTFTATETEKKYLNYYPFLKGKTETILNSFESFDGLAPKKTKKNASAPFKILFLGSFRSLSTAEAIIKVCAELKKKFPAVYQKVEVHSYANLEPGDMELADSLGVIDRFVTRNRVPHEQINTEMETADLLLLSTKPERNDIIPAKLFDYLPSGKPVLSLLQNPEVDEILNSTGTGKQFYQGEEEGAAQYIKEVFEETYTFNPDFDVIKNYSTEARVRELDLLLKKVLENAG